MKTNKKLKLNTKKVIILSDEQQNAVQGGNERILTNYHSCKCFPTDYCL